MTESKMLEACYPHPNKAEVSTEDLCTWHTSRDLKTYNTQRIFNIFAASIASLEFQLAELKEMTRQIEELRQVIGSKGTCNRKKLPQPEERAP